MGAFDFVSSDTLRQSLEADYNELHRCFDVQAWKAVHVLAGSIVEALLIDYLVSINYTASDPLKMDLAEATAACKQAGAISSQAADLTTVIRGYRNLIHPGRIVRLDESVTQEGATVAKSLVQMVIRDIARNTYRKHGHTAEDIINKIRQDPGARDVIKQLINDLVDVQLERLL